MNTCKSFERKLAAYLHGELYESEYHALRAHLETCASCRAELEAERATLELLGQALATAPAPVRLSAWRHLPRREVNLRQSLLARIWFSPQFKAVLATGVLASFFFLISGTFVVFTVMPKEEAAFIPPAPMERPRMKLKQPQVKVAKGTQPMPSSRIVAKVKTAPMSEIAMPEIQGMQGGDSYGYGGLGWAEGMSLGFSMEPEPSSMPLADATEQTFEAAVVQRPSMKLMKPQVTIQNSSQPEPSSRIVTKVKNSRMPEIALPDLVGTGEGLLGGSGFGGDFLGTPDISAMAMSGRDSDNKSGASANIVGYSAYDVDGEGQGEMDLFGYADPFADKPVAASKPAPAVLSMVLGRDVAWSDSAEKKSEAFYDAYDVLNDPLPATKDQLDQSSVIVSSVSGERIVVNKSDLNRRFGGEPAGLAMDWERDGMDDLFGDPPAMTRARDEIVALNRKMPQDLDADGIRQRPRKPAVFNPYVMAAENAFSTFSIDVDTASYGLARRQLLAGALPEPEAVRTEEFINSFDYDYRPPSGTQTFAVHTEMAPSPFRSRMEVLKIGVKARRIGRDDHRGAVLTLVIDTSGSMSTPERLGLVKQSLALLIDQLNPEDQVAIVQFGGEARLVCEHTPAGNKAKLLAAIDALQAGGPTQFDKGLVLGYKLATDGFSAGDSNRIIILSDGVANLGELDPDSILEQVADFRRKGIYLSVLGFGAGAYDDELLERLANRGDGTYAYIDTIDEARYHFVDQLAATLHVIASDVKIQVEFNPARVLRYRQLGYENRQLTKEQFRDDTVDAGEVGSGQSVTALYEVELKPDGPERDPVATVYVRYRRADNAAIEEISSRVMDPMRRTRFEDTDPRFRLAACVAEFAERLRRSPYAEGTEMADILERLQPVVLELELDEQVQELLRLISVANGLEQ